MTKKYEIILTSPEQRNLRKIIKKTLRIFYQKHMHRILMPHFKIQLGGNWQHAHWHFSQTVESDIQACFYKMKKRLYALIIFGQFNTRTMRTFQESIMRSLLFSLWYQHEKIREKFRAMCTNVADHHAEFLKLVPFILYGKKAKGMDSNMFDIAQKFYSSKWT